MSGKENMKTIKFKKNYTYYLKPEGWKLKFIEEKYREKISYCFKVIEHNDPIDDLIEYETKDGSEISRKKEE